LGTSTEQISAAAAPALPQHERSPDLPLLFATRSLRMLAYGGVSIILALYLKEIGLPDRAIGLLVTLTMVGDTIVSLWLTTRADRFGRRRTLVVGAILMAAAGAAFVSTTAFVPLLVAATIGVISPNGKEVGPFLAVEQAALAGVIADARRTSVFAWYALCGSLAVALGNQLGGGIVDLLHRHGLALANAYRAVLLGYAIVGVMLAILFARLGPAVEAARAIVSESPVKLFLGLHRSRAMVMRLSALFALDAFAGGFIMDAFLAVWLYTRWHVRLASLGAIFLVANVLAALSALAAARIARRFGLINTMVFTHLPSNVLLMLVPLAPDVRLAVALLWMRFSISQMDVPTRQSYTMAVVAPDERSAASGITGVARSIGAGLSPVLVGLMFSKTALLDAPLYLAGGLKIVYDLLLYRAFVTVKPPEEAH
jgi:MFS family permease